jgi:leucyl/phenylalanyl-tRNA--protein transferase
MHGTSLTPEVLLAAYAQGLFPMGERRDNPALFWVSPELRGVLPLNKFHVSRRLARTVRSDRFVVTADQAFVDVMKACAAPAPGREESWINDEIVRLYTALHASGHAHSLECWLDGKMVGGLYGVNLGAAFFGESMFSRARDASKVALVHLIARLKEGNFQLLDTQFLTAHLATFGAVEIPKKEYLARLARALDAQAYWPASSGSATGASLSLTCGALTFSGSLDDTTAGAWPGWSVMQRITQTS